MSPQEIEKLLGGYATDTLTEEERHTLFTAALENQALFDALADEQALRELLQDPPSRAQLLAALRQDHRSLPARLVAWLRQPSVLALGAAVAAGIVIMAVVIPRKTAMEQPATVAMTRPAEPLPAPSAVPAPETNTASAPAPKPAPPAPAGSLQKDVAPRRQEPERDALESQNAPTARNKIAALPPPPPPPQAAAPPPALVVPAQPQFKATDEVQVQAAAPKLADAKSPGVAGGAMPQEARKKEAAQPGARELYYSSQAAVSGFVAQPKAGKTKQEFGRAMTMRGSTAASRAPAVFAVRYSILKRNADGIFLEVDPSTVFAPGDALRVRFETNQAGSLTVMERQAGGPWTVRLGTRIQLGEPVYMPADGALNITAAAGHRFFVRFSRSISNELNPDQIAQTPNLLRETAANSVYVANPVAASDPAVDFEFAINAK